MPHLEPGALVVPDQIIDRTNGRAETIYDTFEDGPAHTPFGDPYDANVRRTAVAAGDALAEPVHDGGTVVVINGPRFATRAESRWYRSMGADLINMTQYPEAVIARELGLAYVAVGLVTDHDTGMDDRPDVPAVTQESVLETFALHLPRLRAVCCEPPRRCSAASHMAEMLPRSLLLPRGAWSKSLTTTCAAAQPMSECQLGSQVVGPLARQGER